MAGVKTWVVSCGFLFALLPGVRADEATIAIIAACTVAGLIILSVCACMVIFCLYRNGHFAKIIKKKHRKQHHRKHHLPHRSHSFRHEFQNGGQPHYEKYTANGPSHMPMYAPEYPFFAEQARNPSYMPMYPPEYPIFAEPARNPSHMPMYPPEYPIFAEPARNPYATYHGPPPEFRLPPQGTGSMRYGRPREFRSPPQHSGSMRHGPPPEFRSPPQRTGSMRQPSSPVIVIPTPHGTVTMRADPRPIVKTYQWDDTERRPRMEQGTRRPEPQEFYIQPSYNGVSVIRPVIYVDDDRKGRRKRSRGPKTRKSRMSSDASPNEGPHITEIKSDTDVKTVENESVANHRRPATPPRPRSRSRSPQPYRIPDVRSRTSSVTAAVNQINMALINDDDSESDVSSISVPYNKEVRTEQQAPDPVAGDVMFFPASMDAATTRDRHTTTTVGTQKEEQQKETVYGYTKVIRADQGEQQQTTAVSREIRATTSGSPHPTQTTRLSLARDTSMYETEHSAKSGFTTDMRTTMSDRLTSMVEDGDKSRFTHYNVGADNVNETTQAQHVEMRAPRRPDTPPNDIPYSSAYSTYAVPHQNRPSTPPNDIPLNTPRDSSEIPPLNLTADYTTPRYSSDGPLSPKSDYPTTPKLYFNHKLPSTPPKSPPYDVNTSRSYTDSSLRQSVAADPVTGEPGSFQARKRLIEAHLKNVGTSGNDSEERKPVNKYKFEQTAPKSPIQPVNTVEVLTGVIPPAPPPPPM